MHRLGPGDIASALGQSELTIRTIAHRFVLYLPATRLGEERHFRPEALDIFRLIVQQLEVGVNEEYIEVLLARRYPVAEVSILMRGAEEGTPADFSFMDMLGARPASPAGSPPTTVGNRQPQGPSGLVSTAATTPAAPSQAAAEPAATLIQELLSRMEALEQRLATLNATAATSSPQAQEPGGPGAAGTPAPESSRHPFDSLPTRRTS